MGVDHSVRLGPGGMPKWSAVAERLASRGIEAVLRMIDGELAFPDEMPPDDWRELRVGMEPGMVTVRREAEGVTLVVWGNASDEMLRSRDVLGQAFVEASADQ